MQSECAHDGNCIAREGAILMEINKALDQIAGIHEHLARTNVFGGYRPLILLSIAALGYVAAFFQPLLIPAHTDTPIGFTVYWTVVAILGCGVGVAMIQALRLKWQDSIHEAEFSWVAESNTLSRGLLEKMGAERTKTYRVYDLDR